MAKMAKMPKVFQVDKMDTMAKMAKSNCFKVATVANFNHLESGISENQLASKWQRLPISIKMNGAKPRVF